MEHPPVAVMVKVTPALLDMAFLFRTAAVELVTLEIIVPLGMPVPVMVAPASPAVKIPAMAVMFLLALVSLPVTVRVQLCEPSTEK